MKSSFMWIVFGLFLIAHQCACQNMAGLIATFTGSPNNGYPNTASSGGNSNCPFSPHRLDRRQFIHNGKNMTCAPGTVYDPLKCLCATSSVAVGPPQQGSNPRIEVFSNVMRRMQSSAPPGMEQMMAALMRQFQGQSASGGNNAPPAPIIPGNNNAPTTFPKPFTPSRSAPPANPRRRTIPNVPTQSNTGAPPPPPLPTRKVTKVAKRKPKAKRVNRRGRKGRPRKPARGKKIAKLVLNTKKVRPGPPYDRKPSTSGKKPQFNPIKNTDKLPVDLLKIMQAFTEPTTTTPKPTNPPLRELLSKSHMKGNKAGRKTVSPTPTQQSDPFNTILAMLSNTKQESKPVKKIRPPPPTQPSDQLASLLAMLSNSKQETKPTQIAQPPSPTEPSDPFSAMLAMLSNTKQESKPVKKVEPPPPTQSSDPLSSILAMLSGSKPTNEKKIPPRPKPPRNNPLENMLASVRPTGSGRKFGGPGPSSGRNSILGGGSPPNGFGGNMGNPFAGMNGLGGMGSMGAGALGGLGGGSPDLTNLLGALGGGSGLGALGSLGSLTGSTRSGAGPPDLTNMFNTQGRMVPATMAALVGAVDIPLLNMMDRQGYVDFSDLTPGGKVAASRFFRSGGLAQLNRLGPLGQMG